jgi:hypothetical protein
VQAIGTLAASPSASIILLTRRRVARSTRNPTLEALNRQFATVPRMRNADERRRHLKQVIDFRARRSASPWRWPSPGAG